MHMKANTKNLGPKVVPMKFILEDPAPLGQTKKEIDLKASVGESVLEVALDNDIAIEHACGGVTACSTCHVYLEKGEEACNEPDDDELDRVDEAPGAQLNSRLSCQVRVEKEGHALVVKVPAWNRNAVKEVPH